jgi:uncharacterized protein (TIGR02594 family)
VADFRRVARRKARKYGLRPEVFERQIDQESGFDDDVIYGRRSSPAGAQGIAQIMPATAKAWGVNPLRPRKALDAAAKNMASYVRKYGSYENALRAYNAGPGAIEASKGYAETNNYVRTILRGGQGKPTGREGKNGAGRDAGGRQGSVRLGRPDTFNLSRQTSFDEAGFKQAQRRSLVAQMLQRSGRGNSSLFRTGVLSTAAPDPGEFTSSRLVSSITPGKDPKLTWSEAGGDEGGALPKGAASKAVKAARNRLGVSEVGTSNRGERIDKWSRRYGMVGQPWCGIFVGTVLRRAGVQTDSRIASVAAIETMARNREGNFRGFRPGGKGARQGDLLITRKGQHVAFIERVDKDGTIHTIGGNESGRVQRASYRPGTVYGAVRVRYGR